MKITRSIYRVAKHQGDGVNQRKEEEAYQGWKFAIQKNLSSQYG